MTNDLALLGIAQKAGRLETGEEQVGAAARAKKARLLLLAADAAEGTHRRAESFARVGNVPLVQLTADKAAIGDICGKPVCAMAAITDVGLAAAFAQRLAKTDPDYGELAQTLQQKADKAHRRRREAAAHEKNRRQGKRRKKNG